MKMMLALAAIKNRLPKLGDVFVVDGVGHTQKKEGNRQPIVASMGGLAKGKERVSEIWCNDDCGDELVADNEFCLTETRLAAK